MIFAQPGADFETRVAGFPAALVGVAGVQILDHAGAVALARRTAGIVESPAGSGSYIATLPAPAVEGQYTVFWDEGVISPSTTASEELVVSLAPAPLAPPAGWTPDVADVGDHLRVRTRDDNGNELGTFTAATRPTGGQVTNLIAQAASKVTSKIGDDIPEALWEKARTVIALRAAMFVELSYFGDQVSAGRSPYNELKVLHDEEWKDLYSDWRDLGADQLPGTADDESDAGMPAYFFPPLAATVHTPGSELPWAESPTRPDW